MLVQQRVLFYLFGDYYRITQNSKQNPVALVELLHGNFTQRSQPHFAQILYTYHLHACDYQGTGIRDLIKQRIPANNLRLVPFSVAAYPHYSVAVSLVCSLVRSSIVM